MIDFYVHFKKTDSFSTKTFECFSKSLGFDIALHPTFNIEVDTGFYPMCLTDDRFSGDDGNNKFMTGFEIYTNPYVHVTATVSGKQEKTTFFEKLFRKKKPAKKAIESPLDTFLREADTEIYLRCSGSEILESFVAHIFGAYLISEYGATFDDPQAGNFYTSVDEIKAEIESFLSEILELQKKCGLELNSFEGWN